MTTAAATRSITGTVVSHTHWDREWYLSFERFRMMLVDTIDLLLDILDNEPSFEFFTLDGQTIVLEDYLAIRPENEERLAKHIREGRILIGPWYVLPDEFLISSESLVRNLLLGRKIASKYGSVMPVGYLPDTFGHPAQIPQILQGMGMDNVVLFRGVIPNASEFVWEAPDGSQVLTVFLPGGYCYAMSMTAVPWRFLNVRLHEITGLLRSMATTPNILVMNGCDHLPPRRNLAEVIDEANRKLEDEGIHLKQGTLADHVNRIKEARPKLETMKGEFRKPRPGRVTPGVISARMYLKQENFKTYNLLEKYAEPLAAVAWKLGEAYPQSFLWQAWKYLIQNHPHDSICGCSTDIVHQDMMGRFRWAQEIGNELVHRSLTAIARNISVAEDESVGNIVVFNPLGTTRTGLVEHKLDFLKMDTEFHLRDASGRVVPHQVLKRGKLDLQYDPLPKRIQIEGRQRHALLGAPRSAMIAAYEDGLWQTWKGEQFDVIYEAPDVPAFGYAALTVVPDAAPAQPETDLRAGSNWIENDVVRLRALPSGALELLDKSTGVTYSPFNVYEHSGDVGDEYTYCPPAEDKVITSLEAKADIALVERGPVRATLEIRQELEVPRRASEDRQRRSDEKVCLPINTRVSLTPRSAVVRFAVEIENTAEDARLRAVFPTSIHTEWAHSHSQFEVIKRPIGVEKEELERVIGPDEEVAVGTYPHKTFVDANDGEKGLALFNKGLPEYEVVPGPAGVALTLTLLRSVGWLSRPDLNTRFANAGPPLQTPDAQCKGRWTFEYAALPHVGDWGVAAVQQEADAFVAPMVATHQGAAGGELPREMSFVDVQPVELLLSAVKKAEDEEALIVRFFNTSEEDVKAKVSFGQQVRQVQVVNLAEQPVEAQPLLIRNGDSIELPVRGAQIVTLKVV